MLKVEVVEIDGEDRLMVNSIVDEKSTLSNFGKLYTDIYLQDNDVINILSEYSFGEVRQYIDNFYFDSKIEIKDIEDFSCMTFVNFYHNEEATNTVSLYFSTESRYWKRPFSFHEMSEEIYSIAKIYNDSISVDFNSDNSLYDIGLGLNLNSDKVVIKDKIYYLESLAEKLLVNAQTRLLQNLDKDLITSYFTFPEEIKAACKQYLVYFAQFLMDLGIEADTEIKEEAQQTLFKVIPKNKEESLDKIREALDVYLNIPKDFDIQVAQNNDVAVMQWQANVKHLEGQIMLAKAAMQMKDATIETLQLSNYQYKSILEQKNLEKEPKNEEEIAGGLVKVKEYDGDGFSINLPEILRRLRRIFK